jgi:cytoskeletal protein CcmA (bactofilin family)
MRSRIDSKGDLNGFLDDGSHINGELHFEDTFRIDGKLTGQAISEGDLVVGESGEVDAELLVGRVYISGTVRGTIKAARRVEITAGGRVFADIDTPSLVIEDGALFEGSCKMKSRREGESAKITRLPLP